MRDVLTSIGQIINPLSNPITRQEIFDRLFAQSKQRFVINPEEIISHQNNPNLHQAYLQSQQYAQRQLQTHIDPGALAIDELLAKANVRSNLADALKYPTTQYVLEPGVYYKRQHVIPKTQVRPTIESPGNIMEFVGFKDTPMMDWDTAGPYHAQRNATIRHLGDVEANIQNYIQQNPQANLMLYQTPGGYRAFDLSVRQTPMQFDPSFELLNVDPDYRMIAQQRPQTLKQVGDIVVNDTERFNMRVSPKPGRMDWVAQPIANIQGKESLTDPTSLRRVQTYHDEPIRQNFLQGAAQAAAIEKVKENLPTASQFLQKQIRSYLGM